MIGRAELERLGADRRVRRRWVDDGRLVVVGPASYAINGTPVTWLRSLSAAQADTDGIGVLAGRSAARLMSLDGFADDVVELLVPYHARMTRCGGTMRSTIRPLERGDVRTIDGLRVVSAERLILDAGLFRFTTSEAEAALDSAVRRRLVSVERLRARDAVFNGPGRRGAAVVDRALAEGGVESGLERAFLRLIRRAGFPEPTAQRVVRRDGRTVARVDFEFPGNVIVELLGHVAHASRAQLTSDAARTAELVASGHRVIPATHEHVTRRQVWLLDRLAEALGIPAIRQPFSP